MLTAGTLKREERDWPWKRRLNSRTIRGPIMRMISAGLEASLGDLEDRVDEFRPGGSVREEVVLREDSRKLPAGASRRQCGESERQR